MAYINLKHIGQLVAEAELHFDLAKGYLFNAADRALLLTESQFLTILKADQQAKNLHQKLSKLHAVCSDFALGNFDPYLDEHNQWEEMEAEEDRIPYDPFDTLEGCLSTMRVDGLPARIEQYDELLTLANRFAQLRATKREGLQRFFGAIPRYYEGIDETGETVLIPEAELPEQTRLELAINQQIRDIEIEHALDGYNEFYDHVTGLLSSSGNVQACADAILSLYNPSDATVN